MGDNNGYILLFIALLHMGYAGRIVMREYAGGRPSQSSVSPKALPLHPHPLGHGNQCYIFDV